MKGQPVKYEYSTSLEWTGEHKGRLQCTDKPDLNVACPPEWGGHPGIWSPEDLFIGSVEVCTLTTFLWLAEKERVPLKSYQSKATGIAQMIEKEFQFPVIEVNVRVVVPSRDASEKALKLFQEIGRWCLVSKSLKPEVKIIPEVIVEEPE